MTGFAVASDARELCEERFAFGHGGFVARGGSAQTDHRTTVFIGIRKPRRKGLEVFHHGPTVIFVEIYQPGGHGSPRHSQGHGSEQIGVRWQLAGRRRAQPEIALNEIARFRQQECRGIAFAVSVRSVTRQAVLGVDCFAMRDQLNCNLRLGWNWQVGERYPGGGGRRSGGCLFRSGWWRSRRFAARTGESNCSGYYNALNKDCLHKETLGEVLKMIFEPSQRTHTLA